MIALILELIVMSASLVRQIQTGQQSSGIEAELLAIVKKGIEAYTAQTGKPIDPSLLQTIDEV